MASTIVPMRSERSARSRIASVTACELRATSSIVPDATRAASAPSSATARARAAAEAVSRADSALSEAISAACWAASRTASTIRTWRSDPEATSPTAEAISCTARPVSSLVPAISSDAVETVAAVVATSPIISPRRARMAS